MRIGLWPLIVLGVLLFLAFAIVPGIYVDWLWFDQLGQLPVYLLRFQVQAALFAGVALLSFAVLAVNIVVARRFALAERFVFAVDRRRGNELSLDPRIVTRLALVAALLISLFIGLIATEGWSDWLRFQNATPFGVADPLFGQDLSYYIFQLPIYLTLRTWLLWLIAIAFGFTVMLYGGGRLAAALSRSTYRGAGIVHLSLLGAAWLAVQAWSYLLQRYELLYERSAILSGPGYSAVNALLPGYQILAGLVVLGIVALLANLAFRRLGVVWAALGVWLVASVILTGIYPGLVERFVVTPNQLALEQQYLAHAIAFTRQAYGLDAIQEAEYEAQGEITANEVLSDSATIENIRLWDYRPLLDTFSQIQEIRRYYEFRDVDVEAYTLAGELRQVMLAAREIDVAQLPEETRTWLNQHLIYTHGYGVAANAVSQVGAEGLPVLLVRDIPPVSTVPELAITRPEIYFGELTENYVIVGTSEAEFDYPSGDQNVYSTYAGAAGVPLGGGLGRLMFASAFGASQILLSPALTADSQVLYYRSLRERVAMLAPFLLYDGDPYLVIADGRLVWVQDAYTYDQRYPYSAHYSDPYEPTGRDKASISGAALNYVRNAVKVTIDAYDGSTTFYINDPQDPIVRTWARIYPSLFQPLEQMPAAVRRQLRYPEGLFRTQATMYATYHMRDPRVLYNGEDTWDIAQELVGDNNQRELIEPYYVVMRLPDRERAEFVLMLPFTPLKRDNMIAWMYAQTLPDGRSELGVFKFGKQELVYGPMQIEGRVNQDTTISAQLTLWNQQGSSVIRGNLLVIPVSGGLLYVEPIYLRSSTGSLPELKRVVVAYRTNIAMAPTLGEALAQVFGLAEGEPGPTPEPPAGDVAALVAAAQDHYSRAQECLQSGDWACYGSEQAALAATLEALAAAVGEAGP
jgi:hypothetical protein